MKVAAIERELAELWRSASSMDQTVVRACKNNLVIVCADGSDDVHEATLEVARIAETEPGRALVVAPLGDKSRPGGTGPEAYVSAHCHRGAGGTQVCCEQVTVEATNDELPLVAGSLLQMLVEDTPVFSWWRRGNLDAPTLLEPLRDLSDRLIVDSATFTHPQQGLRRLLAVATEDSWKGQPADLAWVRLDPWREALASFFDLPLLRGYLERITEIVVLAGGPEREGRTATGAYMAGWLSSRLDWTPTEPGLARRRDGAAVTVTLRHAPGLAAGEIAEARIVCRDGDATTSFVTERVEPGSDFVRLTVETEDACPLPRVIKLPSRDDAALVCGVLQMPGRDAIYDAGLVHAAQFA